jgi:glycosyltransferase involved in cell wall biosynthesis
MITVLAVLLALLAVVVALPGVGAAAHLGLLAAASLLYREPTPRGRVPRVRFLVMIPAHNKELVLAQTLAAVNADRRDGDHVVVVADRCTDATAEIARDHGAIVLERGPGEPGGRAPARQDGIAYALGHLGSSAGSPSGQEPRTRQSGDRDVKVSPAEPPEWDAMVMIDADSIIEPGFFDACERMLAIGPPALQARSEAEQPERAGRGLVAQASLAAFAIQGLTMPRGRDRLGFSVRLRGTGMVLRREVVEHFRFRAPASEDLWFSLDLCLAGILPRPVESARLRSASTRSMDAFAGQKTRYEAGRMSAAREYLPKLLRRRTKGSLEAAWFLATPPFAVAVGSIAAGLALALLAGALGLSWALAWTLAAALVVLVLVLVVALVQARAGLDTWLALLAAPVYVPWKLMVQLRALLSVRRGETTYGPTARQ